MSYQHLDLSIHTNSLVADVDRLARPFRGLIRSRELWNVALEAKNTQPPLNPSRLYSLKLSTAELRNEVLRGVKLDRNWSSKYGPSARHENLMALNRLDQ